MWTAVEWAAFGSVVTAIATVLLVVATGALIWAIFYQIGRVRDEAKMARTLVICERYDTDAILHDACVNVRKAIHTGKIKIRREDYRTYATIVPNYFEQIALGIDSGVYDEELAKRFIGTLAVAHVDELSEFGLFDLGDFSAIGELADKWRESPTA